MLHVLPLLEAQPPQQRRAGFVLGRDYSKQHLDRGHGQAHVLQHQESHTRAVAAAEIGREEGEACRKEEKEEEQERERGGVVM